MKEDDSDEDAIYQERTKLKRVIGRVRLKIKRNLMNSTVESGEGDKEDKKRIIRRRSFQKRRGDGDNNVSTEVSTISCNCPMNHENLEFPLTFFTS